MIFRKFKRFQGPICDCRDLIAKPAEIFRSGFWNLFPPRPGLARNTDERARGHADASGARVEPGQLPRSLTSGAGPVLVCRVR